MRNTNLMPIFTKPMAEFRLFIQHDGRYEDLCFKNGVSGANVSFKNGVSGANVSVIYQCV
jgi:hypothetical protein